MRSLLTLSVLLALIRENKGQKPKVSLLPKFPAVFVGDDITLICNGGGEPIQWFINRQLHSHTNSSMLLTAVTSKNNGTYECERGSSRSDPYTLTVLELEPHAQLSPSVGGAVMTKGGGRNLVLQVDDGVKGWKCYVLRGESGSRLGIIPDEKKKKAVMFAELNEAKRATFWCKNGEERSNAVTLKMTELKVMLEPPAVPALMGENVALRCAVWGGGKVEKAAFYKNHMVLKNMTEDTYIITNATQDNTGVYSCHATYRYSHISADAARQEGDSDAQEFKVIGGPPAATVDSTSHKSLQCSCRDCSADCTSYHWYHTLLNDLSERRRLPENTQIITVEEEEGWYSCRLDCGKGFSRFSNVYNYKPGEQPETKSVNVAIIVAAILMFVVVLIVVVIVVVMCRRSRGSRFQPTERRTGEDFDQIQLTNKSGQEQGAETKGSFEPL